MSAFHIHIIQTRQSDEPQYIASKAWLLTRGVVVI
jgi:hypothetical protein